MLVYLEDNQKKKYLIEDENFKIGRDGSQCQLKLPENLLFSAVQAIVVIQEDVPVIEKFILVDKSSNKNTYVNGKKIDKRVLKHGDRIAFARDQNVSFTFKINISDPTMVSDAETFIKPQLEEKKQDLQSTIKESTAESLANGAKILDKEIEDLRNLMQNNMMKSNVDPNLGETKDEIIVPDGPVVISPLLEKKSAENEKVSVAKIIGEETEVDVKSPEKMEALRQAYSKVIQGKNTPTVDSGAKAYLVSVLDGQYLKIDKDTFKIGTEANADISFSNDNSIAQINGKIIRTVEGFTIDPLEYGNIIVNGLCLQEPLQLKNADTIRLSKQILYFFDTEEEAKQFVNLSKQKKNILKNFHTIQDCSTAIDLSSFQLQIQTKLCDKENALYFVTKNNENVFVLLGDIIGANLAFTLIAQELRGAFSVITSQTSDLKDIVFALNDIVKKYVNYTCENNTPITAKILLLKFTQDSCEWLNIGGHLSPIAILGEQKITQDMSYKNGIYLLGYLNNNAQIHTEEIPFNSNSIMLVQPDCTPSSKTSNFKKLLLQSKDVHHLVSRLPKDDKFLSNFMKHVLSSNVTSVIAITRKTSDLKCATCQRTFPPSFLFCPYDSTKLV